eukprot:GDKJ01035743.1.p1 GENE.GDKJ01035743.1~~GDKJ01035743.1.p1  ORF type:complete len:392 (+),score=45.50 GDKJ01035743.1:1111-2286(+)
MDVLLYLTALLQTNKTVGIIGLGTLYKKKSPGKYDAEKHAFIPPSYHLAFTETVLESEALANEISEKRKLSLDNANYYISEFVAKVKTELAEKQEANLAPLGKLIFANAQLSFTASEESNFSFEFFGLPEVIDIAAESDIDNTKEIEKIEEENKLEEENPGFETIETIIPSPENQLVEEEKVESNPAPIIHYLPNDEAQEEEEEYIATTNTADEPVIEEQEQAKTGMSFFTKFLIVLLVIAVLGAIAYFINPAFFNNYFNKNYQGKQDQNVPTLPKDTLANQLDTPKTDSIAKSNVAIPKDTTAIDSSKITTFEVLVSAVKTDKMADKIIANLAKENIKAKKIRLTKSKISISAGTFLNKKAAVKYRDSLRIKLKNEGIYEKEITPNNPKK